MGNSTNPQKSVHDLRMGPAGNSDKGSPSKAKVTDELHSMLNQLETQIKNRRERMDELAKEVERLKQEVDMLQTSKEGFDKLFNRNEAAYPETLLEDHIEQRK